MLLSVLDSPLVVVVTDLRTDPEILTVTVTGEQILVIPLMPVMLTVAAFAGAVADMATLGKRVEALIF